MLMSFAEPYIKWCPCIAACPEHSLGMFEQGLMFVIHYRQADSEVTSTPSLGLGHPAKPAHQQGDRR